MKASPPAEPNTAAADAPSPARRAINTHLDRYLATLEAERNLSRFTVRNYANDLRHLFDYLDAHGIDALGVTRTLYRGYLATMREAGVAQASIVRRVSTARSFYKWMRFVGVMSSDPLANVVLPKQPRRLPHTLTLSNITDLIAAADSQTPRGLRDRALLESMYASGLRVSEAHALDVADVDLEQFSLRVLGKGNKQRIVVMGEPARAALRRYLAARAQIASTNITKSSVTQALFINRHGGRLSQRAVQILVRKYALKAGIDARVHPHLLRHTFATHLLDGGAALRVVQELMGHASPNTTQIYLHVTEERQRSVLEGSLDGLAAVEMARRAARDGAPGGP